VKPLKELFIIAESDNLPAFLEFIEEELQDCHPKVLNKLRIAAEEIFLNIAGYAYSPDVGGVTVRVFVGDEVMIEFEDKGAPYNPLERDEPDFGEDGGDIQIGGWGIYMVKELMDSCDYRNQNGKNIFTIHKSL
jgi:anti-sigma regulatory factor (Ser/Thr protein kinase)